MEKPVLNTKSPNVLTSGFMAKEQKKQQAPAVSKEFSEMLDYLMKKNRKIIRELSKH